MNISIQILSIKTTMPTEKSILITIGQYTKRMQINNREDFKINLNEKLFYRILDNESLDIGNGKTDIWPSIKMMNLNNFPEDHAFNLVIKEKLEKCELTYDANFLINQKIRDLLNIEKSNMKMFLMMGSGIVGGKGNHLDLVRRRITFGICFMTGITFLSIMFHKKTRQMLMDLGWIRKFTLLINRFIVSKLINIIN